MKRILILLGLAAAVSLQAQKKPLDHSVFDAWQSVANSAISPSGQVITYEVNPQEGDGTLYIRICGKKQDRELVIPRGYNATVLDDDSYAVCLIKPYFQKTRRAKIDKKKADEMPKDSLAVIHLASGQIVRKFPDVKGYKLGKHALQAFAFATADTCFIPKAERKKKDIGGPLAVYYFADGSLDTLRNVSNYSFSEDGLQLALVRQLGKKKMNAGFYQVASRQAAFLPDTCVWLGLPVFDKAGSKALFLTAADTLSSGSKHAVLHLWEGGTARVLTSEASLAALPQGWGITENSKPSFSHNGERIFVGVQAYVPPKDTSLVSFETPGLDIWNWDAPEIPPYQKSNLKREELRTYTTEVVDGKLIPFTTAKKDRFYLGNRGDSPVNMIVRIDNPVESQWNIQMSKTLLINGQKVSQGPTDNESLSPEAKYAIWWDYSDLQWHICNTSTQTVVSVRGSFAEEDDDHPMRPEPYGMAGWTAGDSAVLLYDKYDIWSVTPDGLAVRQTRGREKGLTYRYIDTRDREEERFIPDNIYVSVFDNATKENGVASLALYPGKKDKLSNAQQLGGYSYSGFRKARNADVLLFQKGNFRQPMDLYRAAPKSIKKLSAINPQIEEYNWGTVELYHWTAFDGTKLDGLLYKPEDFDQSKKYPVICYFYEKDSETLYSHIQVQPMWSIINIPFFVSRGYVVFVPDIVYHPGIPGESAYNCIVSGAQSLWQYPWIDRDNMAIQGQSWGGYQVAYLITRTSMFKAAGAGAPVSNMTSAYGGIRWESGMSRQFQYEQTQSRIGRDLWNGIELYMENSPLFKLPNVTTPVLIMHNDNDGAVPWYQGIEMFMGLRRLGKPAWLLEYNDEAHNLRQRRNRKDLSIRLQQFFDYYLKGEPEPAWMRDGIPTAKKGYYFGYEY